MEILGRKPRQEDDETMVKESLMVVQICLTIRNSRDEWSNLVHGLQAQLDAPPFVVCVVDGASDDGTYEVLLESSLAMGLRVRVDQRSGNISVGRNHAIAMAEGDLIVTTDAGVELPPHWLRDLTAPLLSGVSRFTAGTFIPKSETAGWQSTIGAAITPLASEFAAGTVEPSARSTAFWKSDWEAIGRYPEDLDHCEDLVFYRALQQRVGPVHWVLTSPVIWDARSSLEAFFRQYCYYARGDAMAGILRRRHFARYAFYSTAALSLVAAFRLRWAMLVILLAWMALTRRPRLRLLGHVGTRERSWLWRVRAASTVQLVGDIAKMYGFVQGSGKIRTRLRPTHTGSS